jgi:hypothetical protein
MVAQSLQKTRAEVAKIYKVKKSLWALTTVPITRQYGQTLGPVFGEGVPIQCRLIFKGQHKQTQVNFVNEEYVASRTLKGSIAIS